ncbi:hypothetical protein TRVL_05704 [Trypanosoma vivax]|nr:hypothetical protein TRVL_05704 [Trypanosoma vivax]
MQMPKDARGGRRVPHTSSTCEPIPEGAWAAPLQDHQRPQKSRRIRHVGGNVVDSRCAADDTHHTSRPWQPRRRTSFLVTSANRQPATDNISTSAAPRLRLISPSHTDPP